MFGRWRQGPERSKTGRRQVGKQRVANGANWRFRGIRTVGYPDPGNIPVSPSYDRGMRIATWCVGGINSRWKYLSHWLARRNPDVVALQKTFARSDRFPQEALRYAGYESVYASCDGAYMNGWGVAVLTRDTLPKPQILQNGLPGQEDRGARFLTVGVGDLKFSSVYALYEDPRTNGFDWAIQRKIAWLKRLREHVEERFTSSERCVLAGDFNVVTDGPAQHRRVNWTTSERGELKSLLDLGFVDLYRRRHPDSCGTGWNYEFNPHKPVSTRLHRMLSTETVASRINEAWGAHVRVLI